MENKGVEVSKNMTLTHIDLFAGIGGFSLGFEKAGIETLAHVEIDAKCQAVLRNHWPTHLLFSDICEVGSHNLPYADIISFGSPCQDLSVAGKRAGLAGGRSGLFFEAARIIREIDPRYAVWENVPGALSSHNGRDFQSVIECLLNAGVPMPRSGRWASSGMVRIGQKEIAWRVLDAQYFGVAQRRRRIFLVFCARGDSASSVLFEREGVRWNPPSRGKEGEEVAGTLDEKSASSNRGSQANEHEFLAVSFSAGNSGKSYGIGYGEEVTPPFRTGASGTNQVPTIAVMAHGQANAEILEDQSPTLSLNHEAPIAIPINTMAATRPQGVDENRQTFGVGEDGDPMFTLQENHNRAVCWDLQQVTSKTNRSEPKEDYSHTLNQAGQMMVGIRRLTPTECERLQGFPDGWTAGQADSARYRQLGNAVCVPVAEWIGRRIVEVESETTP